MKKQIGLLSLLLICALPLTSCNSEQKVTVKDQNGKDVEVTIKKSTEEEDITNALMYATQASYDDVEGFSLDGKVNLDFGINKDHYFKLDTNIKSQASIVDSYLNVNLGGNVKLKGVMTETQDDNYKGNINFKVNDSLDVDPNIYCDVNLTDNEDEIKFKAKATIEDLFGLIAGLPSSPKPVKRMNQIIDPQTLPTPEEIMETINEMKKELPNTFLEVSAVNGKDFTIAVKISVNDLLKSNTMEGETPDLLEKDIYIKGSYTFDLKTARVVKADASFEGSEIVEKIFGTNSEINVTKDAKFKLLMEEKINYKVPKVEKLTDSQKLKYLPIGSITI